MQTLNDRQLETLRRDYKGFREYDAHVRRVRADEKKYRENPGYQPAGVEIEH